MMQLCRDQARNPTGSQTPETKGIGPYIFKHNLGLGATGTVKLAYNVEEGSYAAVKIVDKTVTRKRKEAKKEIKVLRGVEFEHIIRLENIEEDPLNIYIFTEYYEQGDLFAYIQKHGVFDEAIAKFLFRQMVEAVDYCHTKLHICHHDIKLENLVINQHLNLKLIDFGFAIPLEPTTGKKMIKIYDGSPAYSSLEVLMRRPHDESVDIYSLGVCLYYMLCGCFPFCKDKANYEELVTNVQSQNLEFPEHLSPYVRDLIRRLLAQRSFRISCEDIRQHSWFKPNDYHF